jgi:hypothetical protein
VPRILSKALDEAAEEVAKQIEPALIDSFTRVANLKFDYNRGKWEAILAAITDKMPSRLDGFPMKKEERMEILGVIDFLDRSVRMRGHNETAEQIFRSFVGMFDLFDGFRRFIGLRVLEDDKDVTEEIFGAE